MIEPRKSRRPRRVRTEPAPGSDPTPQSLPRGPAPARASEDTDRAWGDAGGRTDANENDERENDERLKRDVPPHW